ncbi:hypothetical protein HDU77_006710 [Chytriomyces hyalinus]|nr:hypothetical protein HDU77_006710 [Chytriomyces hyalinus]
MITSPYPSPALGEGPSTYATNGQPDRGDTASSTLEYTSPIISQATLVHVQTQKRSRVAKTVMLCAPTSPRDVMTIRNELARIEAAAGVSLLDDAALLFGGTANWSNPADFHAKNIGGKLKKAKDLELEAYGHLSFAASIGHPLLIVGVNPRTYLHFSKIAYIIEESDHGMACQFSLILNTKQEFTFICNSSYDYLQWITALQEAYKTSHPFANNYGYDYDDRRSIASGRSGASQMSYYSTNRRNTAPATTDSRARSTSRSRSRAPAQANYGQVENYGRQQSRDMYYQQQMPSSPYSYQQQELNQRRSVPNMSARAISPGRQYYQEEEFDGGYDDMYGQSYGNRNSQQGNPQERFRRSTRPTKLYTDDSEYNDGPNGSSNGYYNGSSNHQEFTQTSRNSDAKPKSARRTSPTTEEVYEMTVKAYKAGLADDVDEDRTQRNSKRFSSSGRAGYPTRAGSQVRFTGEDEVAYDTRLLSSDGSSMASRQSSLQRRSEAENEDRASAKRGSPMPISQRSKSVDPRFANGRDTLESDMMNRTSAMSRQPVSPGGIPMSKRSYSIDAPYAASNLRTPSVDSRRNGSINSPGPVPMNSPAVRNQDQRQTKQQPLYSLPAFSSRNSSRDSRKVVDSLFEDGATKKEREANDKKTGNEHAKNYLLAKLFGGKQAARNDSVRSDVIPLTSSTSTKDQLVENTRINSTSSSGWAEPEYLAAVASSGDASTKNAATVTTTTTTTSYTTVPSKIKPILEKKVRNSPEPTAVGDSPQQSRNVSPTKDEPIATKQISQAPAQTSSSKSSLKVSNQKSVPANPAPSNDNAANRTSIANSISSVGSSSSKANIAMSPYVDFMDNDIMAHLTQKRQTVPSARGATGTTASTLGLYDENGLVRLNRLPKSPLQQSGRSRDDEIDDSDSSFGAEMYTSGGVNSVGTLMMPSISQTRGVSPISRMREPEVVHKEVNVATPVIVQNGAISSAELQATFSPNVAPSTPVYMKRGSSGAGGYSNNSKHITVTTTSSTYTTPTVTSVSMKEDASSAVSAVSSPSTAADGYISPRRQSNRNTKMSASSAALRESLMASLQSSSSFQNASAGKTDRERVLQAAQELAKTLEKMDPIVRSPVVGAPAANLPAASDGGNGAVRRSVGAFESLSMNGSSSKKNG